MGYNWGKIFKEKDEKELLNIYSSKSLLDYEAEIYAGLELKNRKVKPERSLLLAIKVLWNNMLKQANN